MKWDMVFPDHERLFLSQDQALRRDSQGVTGRVGRKLPLEHSLEELQGFVP